jgi:TolB-like protein
LSPTPIKVASVDRVKYLLPERPSIAVLPFANISGDPKEDYLGDGIAEEIITALSKNPKLFVIDRNSTLVYKEKPVSIKQVAEDLGVQYVLEGSFQRTGDKVRITAQLIDALSGYHLWAERYDGHLKDIFALQGVITVKITSALLVGDVVAGEKFKGRTVWYRTKSEQINVPGEEKHLVAVREMKGIGSNTEGKAFYDRVVWECVSLTDLDLKVETGFAHGYTVGTDRDGDKIIHQWESKPIKGKYWASTWNTKFTFLRGTGKYEGIKVGGTSSTHNIAPNQAYEDWELEVELPR